jgi:hypothetical protein
LGKCAIVFFRFAVLAAFLMFRLAAARCFVVGTIPCSPSPPDLDVDDLHGLRMSRFRRICMSRAQAGQNVGATGLAVRREEAMMKAFCESPLAEIRGAIGNVFQHRGDWGMSFQWVLRGKV